MEYLQRVHSGSDWAPNTKMQMQERTALFTPMGTAPKSAAHVALRHLIHLLQYSIPIFWPCHAQKGHWKVVNSS